MSEGSNYSSYDSTRASRRSLLKAFLLGVSGATTSPLFAADSTDSVPPYDLDGCRTFQEYKAKRKAQNKPCLPVVVPADDPARVYDPGRCRNCGRCDSACLDQTVSHWFDRKTLKSQDAVVCTYCGQCVAACRHNVLTERLEFPTVASEIAQVVQSEDEAIKDVKFVAIAAPALRVSLGEIFGLAPGKSIEGQLPAALRTIGFDYVLDATFGADLTTVEEAAELRRRLDDPSAPRTMFTSCCPAWVRFVETFYPELIPNLSTTRSPLMAQSAAIRTKFAEANKLDPKKIVAVAIVPCVGKKFEASRPENKRASKYLGQGPRRDLDVAITTRELGAWLGAVQLDATKLEPEEFDSLIGSGSGAGKGFGASGGVLASVLRQFWKDVDGSDPADDLLELKEVRGIKGVRETTLTVGNYAIRAAVVCGLANARKLIDDVKSGKVAYDVVEVMACPGGCVGGGGQPQVVSPGRISNEEAAKLQEDALQKRADGLIALDKAAKTRVSGDNPELQAFYKEFVGEPGGKIAEALLHTSYQALDIWK